MDPVALSCLLAAAGPVVIFGASVTWPLIAAGVALVTALALWGLFRRGSIADRARADYGDSDETDPGARG